MLVDKEVNNTSLTSSQSDALLHDFSKVLAKALSANSDLRSFIRNESLKKTDGDYDVFYQKTKDEIVSGTTTLHSLLESYSDDKSHFNFIVNSVLDLNIKVPVLEKSGPQEWDTQNYSPLVAVRESGIFKKTLKNFTAYDAQGSKHYLDVHTAPEKVTVVVELSERIHVDNLASLQQSVDKGIQQFKIDPEKNLAKGTYNSIYSDVKDFALVNSRARSATCPREDYSDKSQVWETITVKANAWNRTASDQDWAEGDLEFHATFIYADGTTATVFSQQEAVGTVSIVRRYDPTCSRCYQYIATQDVSIQMKYTLVKWNKNASGDRWKVVFIEKDGGNYTVKKTVSFGTSFEFSFTDPFTGKLTNTLNLSKEITYTDQDDELGESFIYYCDPLYTDYEGMTDIKFSMGIEGVSPPSTSPNPRGGR